MIGKSPRLVAIGIGCLVGAIAFAPLARAEDTSTHLAEPTPNMPIHAFVVFLLVRVLFRPGDKGALQTRFHWSFVTVPIARPTDPSHDDTLEPLQALLTVRYRDRP